jgi:hypothetical protein
MKTRSSLGDLENELSNTIPTLLVMWGHQVLLRTKDTHVLPCDKDAVLLNASENLLDNEGRIFKRAHPLGF